MLEILTFKVSDNAFKINLITRTYLVQQDHQRSWTRKPQQQSTGPTCQNKHHNLFHNSLNGAGKKDLRLYQLGHMRTSEFYSKQLIS